MRGTSTVVDATLFLVLVSAAAVTLAGLPAEPPQPDGEAAEFAAVLATSTAQVNYSLAPSAGRIRRADTSPSAGGPAFDRTAHGTLAGLLADAAVGNVTVDGTQVTHTSDGFERRVAKAVGDAIRVSGNRVAVRATWEPYPGADVVGHVRVGPEPPPAVDVRAAVIAVPSGFPDVRDRAVATARTQGYGGVARVVAAGIVEGLFPPRATRLALRGDPPVDALTAHRYRRIAELSGATVEASVGAARTEEANRRLTQALAARVEADLRAAFDSPLAAARAVAVGEVRITVRTWSA